MKLFELHVHSLRSLALSITLLISIPLFSQNLGTKSSAVILNDNTKSEKAERALLNAPAPRELDLDFINSLNDYFQNSKEQELIPLFESMGVDTLNTHPELLFMLGLAYQSNYQFKKAIATFKKSKNTFSQKQLEILQPSQVIYDQVNSLNRNWVTEKGEVKFMNRVIEKKIEECKNAIALSSEPKKAIVTNPGNAVNSQYIDFGPVFRKSDSTMFFTSRRPETIGGNTFNKNGDYYEDIYVASKKNGKWTETENIGRPVNGRKHDAVVGATSDGDTLFVYCGRNGGNLHYTVLDEDGKYQQPIKIGNVVNSEFTERSLTMSPDQQLIVFERDNDPNGFGGGDLYQSSHLGNDEWTEPINLGQTINTEFDEDGAFLAEDGKTLYFSSKGHNSMGGFDIFYSIRENGKWSSPVNMGAPINSPKDDIYFNISQKKALGYFSSNRKSSLGRMDIFKAKFDTTPDVNYIVLKGNVLNALTRKEISANLTIKDRNNQDVILVEDAFINGNYLARLASGKIYRIEVKSIGFEKFFRTLTLPEKATKKNIKMDIELMPVGKPQADFGLFAFDKSKLTRAHKKELDAIAVQMKNNQALLLRIEGHSDNKGPEDYNLDLSRKRAERAYSYLVKKKGILEDRLSWRGFGESNPVAPNKINGKDNPAGRELNRRNEFVFSWDLNQN